MRFFLIVFLMMVSSLTYASSGRTFTSQVAVDSPLYEAPVATVSASHDFTIEGVHDQLHGIIPVEGCGALNSTVESAIKPNVMDGGQSAFVTLTISNSTSINPKPCETEALAQVPAVNVDVPIQAGTSKLKIRHPQMRYTEYEVTVVYHPDGA